MKSNFIHLVDDESNYYVFNIHAIRAMTRPNHCVEEKYEFIITTIEDGCKTDAFIYYKKKETALKEYEKIVELLKEVESGRQG